MVSSVNRAHYGVSRAIDFVSVDCGTFLNTNIVIRFSYCSPN